MNIRVIRNTKIMPNSYTNILEIGHIILQLDRNKYLNNNSQDFKIVAIRIHLEGIRYAHALYNERINIYLHK